MKEENNGKQMKDVWESSLTKPSEKKCGKHPTQKPMEILEKIIQLGVIPLTVYLFCYIYQFCIVLQFVC